MYSKVCKHCSVTMYRRKKSEAERVNWLYCSASCKGKDIPKKEKVFITKICSFCNEEFKRQKSKRTMMQKYCSLKCNARNNLKVFERDNPDKIHKIRVSNGKKFLGTKNSLETRLKKSLNNIGSKSHFWKGGITKESDVIRQSLEYKLWREAVFERDDWTCQMCLVRGVELQADHIRQFAYYPELRFELSNGRTLCKPCHMTTDTYLVKGKKSRKDLLF